MHCKCFVVHETTIMTVTVDVCIHDVIGWSQQLHLSVCTRLHWVVL